MHGVVPHSWKGKEQFVKYEVNIGQIMDLNEIFANFLTIEHGVKRGHFIHAHRRDLGNSGAANMQDKYQI